MLNNKPISFSKIFNYRFQSALFINRETTTKQRIKQRKKQGSAPRKIEDDLIERQNAETPLLAATHNMTLYNSYQKTKTKPTYVNSLVA